MFSTRTRQQGDDFPRTVRHDARLNVTVRLLWLMTTLSRKSGYASMSAQRMAGELQSTPAAIRQARQKLVTLGLFAPAERWRYKPLPLRGEDDKAYRQRVRADRRLDLTARCGWLLTNLTLNGKVAISLVEIGTLLGSTEPRAAWAVGRLLDLGHFAVNRGGGGGHKNIYVRQTSGDCAGSATLTEEAMIYDAYEDNETGDPDNILWR